MKRLPVQVLFFALILPGTLYHLRHLAPPGGDTYDTVDRVQRSLYYFAHAPLPTAAHRLLWFALREWGWTAEQVVAASSSMAGGVFCAGLWRYSRNPRAWLMMIFSSLFLVFLGHIENYAWPYACALWAAVLLKEKLAKGASLAPVCFFLAVGTFCHPIVAMVGPGFIWAAFPFSRRTLLELLTTLLIFVGITDVCLLTGDATGFWQSHWVLSLSHTEGTPGRYSLFSLRHLGEWLVFMALSMPLAPFILAFSGFGSWTRWKGFLSITFAITLTWSLVWEPGLGLLDWDLFAWPALFINLLAAEAWMERTQLAPVSSMPLQERQK